MQRKRQQEAPTKADRDVAAAAEQIAKVTGTKSKKLMEQAMAKAKEAGFCTGAVCRLGEIKAWALKEGHAKGSSHMIAFAQAIASAVAKVACL